MQNAVRYTGTRSTTNATSAISPSFAEVLILFKIVLTRLVAVGLRTRPLSSSTRSLVSAIESCFELIRFVVLPAGPDALKLAADVVVELVLDLFLGLDLFLVEIANRVLPPDWADWVLVIAVDASLVVAAEPNATGG